MPAMPELLLLCEYATLNGGERSMLSTLAAVAAARFEPAVIGPADGPLADELRRREIEIVPFALCDAAGRRRSQAALREELAELLRHRPCVASFLNRIIEVCMANVRGRSPVSPQTGPWTAHWLCGNQ